MNLSGLKLFTPSLGFLLLLGCGGHHENKKNTEATHTVLDGAWISKDVRFNKLNDPCHTRLVVEDGRAFLGQSCGKPEHLYHVIAYGSVQVSDNSFSISVVKSCPAVEQIKFPVSGGFAIETGASGGKTLNLKDGDSTFTFTAELPGSLTDTDSAAAGCFADALVIPNFEWSEISDFLKSALGPFEVN